LIEKENFVEPKITLKKIFHRNDYRIAILFTFDANIIAILKKMDASYSKTHRCWYVNYSKAYYQLLKNTFPTLIIDTGDEVFTIKSTQQHALPLVTDANRDLSPIAKSELQLGTPKMGNPEHKKEIPFDEKVRLQLMDNIGKYWVFKMHYH
jgi:hypothetical protein